MITWKENNGRYTSGSKGLLGNLAVFFVEYDSLRTKDDPNKYKLSWTLPFKYEYKDKMVSAISFKDEIEAKQFAQCILNKWFEITETMGVK